MLGDQLGSGAGRAREIRGPKKIEGGARGLENGPSGGGDVDTAQPAFYVFLIILHRVPPSCRYTHTQTQSLIEDRRDLP